MHLQELEKEIIKVRDVFLPSKALSQDFEEKSHMNYTFPVPSPDFKPLKLDSLLRKAILNILQRHDLGNSAVKLVGFIPEEIMNILINEGTYLSENKLDFKLMLHGKISHMIQWALLCLLIEKGEIKITYGNG